MKMEYGEILIRTAKDADAEMLCKWWNDYGIMTHAGFSMAFQFPWIK